MVILQLLDLYGAGSFESTLEEIADTLKIKRSLFIKIVKGLKELGWIESERKYDYTEKNLPHVKGSQYKITV